MLKEISFALVERESDEVHHQFTTDALTTWEDVNQALDYLKSTDVDIEPYYWRVFNWVEVDDGL